MSGQKSDSDHGGEYRSSSSSSSEEENLQGKTILLFLAREKLLDRSIIGLLDTESTSSGIVTKTSSGCINSKNTVTTVISPAIEKAKDRNMGIKA